MAFDYDRPSLRFKPSGGGLAFTIEELRVYYDTLNVEQHQWLRDKAAFEGMSVSAVAQEWGAPALMPSSSSVEI